MKFWHTGLLVHDIDETLDFLCAAPGGDRGKWTVIDVEFPQSEMIVGDGGKLRAAFGRVGGVVYELLQPLDDSSYHAKQLEEQGAGFHHCAYYCEDDYDDTVANLVASGGRIVWEAKHGDEHPCYIEAGGIVFEIINVCPFLPEEC